MPSFLGRIRSMQSEVVCTGVMGWSAYCLLQDPSPFDRFPGAYGLLDRWAGSEVFWAVGCALAALLLGAGIGLSARAPRAALWLRLVGLVGSSLWLCLVGVSFLVSFTHSIGGGALVAMSARCFGLVLPERLR